MGQNGIDATNPCQRGEFRQLRSFTHFKLSDGLSCLPFRLALSAFYVMRNCSTVRFDHQGGSSLYRPLHSGK
jgi:hypothetical protein